MCCFNNCCNFNCCPPQHCPHVTPYPPLPPITEAALQVQLQNSSEGTVANTANVIFDTTILNTSTTAIAYDDTTGIFTINRPGKYLINWWINADGAEQATSIVFRVETGVIAIAASSLTPSVNLQLYGQALIDVTTVPTTFSLVNRTGATVTYGTSLVQGDLVITRL